MFFYYVFLFICVTTGNRENFVRTISKVARVAEWLKRYVENLISAGFVLESVLCFFNFLDHTEK